MALILALGLSACGSVTPAGFLAASRLDPLDTAPSDIVVAVGVPAALSLRDGDAEFRIAFRGGAAASTVVLEEVAPLELRAATAMLPGQSEGETAYVARIPEADAPRIAAVQEEIRALRAAGVSGQGTITIAVTGGCASGAIPSDLTVSTWLQTDAADGFVTLTRRQDLSRAIGAAEADMLRARIRPCAD